MEVDKQSLEKPAKSALKMPTRRIKRIRRRSSLIIIEFK
jgi:hypothetical protein